MLHVYNRKQSISQGFVTLHYTMYTLAEVITHVQDLFMYSPHTLGYDTNKLQHSHSIPNFSSCG